MRKAITGFSISNDCRVGRRQMTALGAAVVFSLAAVLFAAGAASGQQLHHWTNRPAQIPTHQWGFRAPIHMNTWRFPRLTRAAIGERPPVEWTDLPTAEQLRERLDLLGLSESQKERVDRLWNNYQYVNYIDQQRRREEIARVHQQISRARRFDKWYRERQLWQYLNLLQRGERQGWNIFADQLLDILTYDQRRLLYAIEYPADARSRFETARMESEALDLNYPQLMRIRQLHEEYEDQRASWRAYEARELGWFRDRLDRLQQSPVRDQWAIRQARQELEDRYRQLRAEHLLRERMYADRLNGTITPEQTRKLIEMAEGRGLRDRPSDVEWAATGLPSDEPIYAFDW